MSDEVIAKSKHKMKYITVRVCMDEPPDLDSPFTALHSISSTRILRSNIKCAPGDDTNKYLLAMVVVDRLGSDEYFVCPNTHLISTTCI